MKKEYLKPQMSIVALKPHRLLTGSNKMNMVVGGGVSNGTVPEAVINFGGVDEEGTLDPE